MVRKKEKKQSKVKMNSMTTCTSMHISCQHSHNNTQYPLSNTIVDVQNAHAIEAEERVESSKKGVFKEQAEQLVMAARASTSTNAIYE